MKATRMLLAGIILAASAVGAAADDADDDLSEHLQTVSVTVSAGTGSGSGVIVTRVVETARGAERIAFVWTAGHVVDSLRSVRSVITDGEERKRVEFKDAEIVQMLIENGRRVGQVRLDAEVIRFSDGEHGSDLALLMVRRRDFVQDSATFYLEDEIPAAGTEVFHVGSLLGEMGANSMTSGIIAQVGRVLPQGVFDQTTAPAFPGSSGGGVFLASDGRLVGMLLRGADATFNLIRPVREIKEWAEDVDVLWAIDHQEPMPTLLEIIEHPIEEAD